MQALANVMAGLRHTEGVNVRAKAAIFVFISPWASRSGYIQA